MNRINQITLHYKDGTKKELTSSHIAWLFVGMSKKGDWIGISLSGEDITDAYLLRILENAVVLVMNERNRYSGDTATLNLTRACEYCGCKTNTDLRACCDSGMKADLQKRKEEGCK